MVALSLGAVHAPKIDFKADSKGLLSQGNSRVAGNKKTSQKPDFRMLALTSQTLPKKHQVLAGVFSVVLAGQGMVSISTQN